MLQDDPTGQDNLWRGCGVSAELLMVWCIVRAHPYHNRILSMVVPIYNAELAPKTLRGRLVSLNQLAITAGIMVSRVCNALVVPWHPEC